MDFVAVFILVAVLAVCSIGPGLVVLPWLDVDDDEILVVVVVALSWLAVFLAAFGIYLGGLPDGCRWAVTAVCGVCIAARWNMFLRLLSHSLIRVQVAGLCLVLGHALLLQASIRNYNGLLWVGDWYEHFERTMFFIERHDPIAARFLSFLFGSDRSYTLTARPPFMSVQPDGNRVTSRLFGIEGAGVANALLKQNYRLTFAGDAWPTACATLWACASLVGLAAWVSLAAYAFRTPSLAAADTKAPSV